MQITCVHNTENAGFCDLIHTLCTAQAVLSRKLCYNSTVLLRKTWIPITVLSNYHTFVVSKTSLFRRRLQQNRHFVFVLSWLCFLDRSRKPPFRNALKTYMVYFSTETTYWNYWHFCKEKCQQAKTPHIS